MKSPFSFIAEPEKGKRYDNTRNWGGVEIVVSTSEEDHKFSNRRAIVKETPVNYDGPIKIGDTLLVHHNVFKFYNDMKGARRSGKSYFKDNLFFIDEDQFFMYNDGDDWHSHDRFCFVKPMPPTESIIYKNINEEPLMGTMMYPTDYLTKNGISKGDTVSFTPDSEYEFDVDGEKLYRIYDHQITMVL
tara:strand:+ start:2930 stop:3493 length:564 start_codon:yes stop_codon:yes gene_type:complete